jgi:threonine dehydrogenase-like Zn-dependent dehydrogenase
MPCFFLSGSLTRFTISLKIGKIKPEAMITKTIKLNEVAEEGFKTLIEDKENHVKILVDVGSGI